MSHQLNDIPKILGDFIERMHSEASLNKHGLSIVRIIKTRTRSWRDIDGKRWKGYSVPYKFWRTEKGLAVTPQGKNTDSLMVVDSVDGMMANMDFEADPNRGQVVVDIKDSKKKKIAGYWNVQGAGRGKHLFKFWGISDHEERYLAKQAEDEANLILAALTTDIVPT